MSFVLEVFWPGTMVMFYLSKGARGGGGQLEELEPWLGSAVRVGFSLSRFRCEGNLTRLAFDWTQPNPFTLQCCYRQVGWRVFCLWHTHHHIHTNYLWDGHVGRSPRHSQINYATITATKRLLPGFIVPSRSVNVASRVWESIAGSRWGCFSQSIDTMPRCLETLERSYHHRRRIFAAPTIAVWAVLNG